MKASFSRPMLRGLTGVDPRVQADEKARRLSLGHRAPGSKFAGVTHRQQRAGERRLRQIANGLLKP